jgi:hypothetical protein
VAGGWRRPHNEQLHNLNASRNIIRMIKSRRMRLTGRAARTGAISFVRKPEGKRIRGRPRRRCKDF